MSDLRREKQADRLSGDGNGHKPIERWLVIGLGMVATILALVPKTPTLVVGSLVVMFLLGIHPIWNFWYIEESDLRRILALVAFSCILVAVGFWAWPGIDEQQRVQMMFAADRDRPLTDLYVIFKLEKQAEIAELRDFAFVVTIHHLMENEPEKNKTIALTLNTTTKQPLGQLHPVLGMQIQAALFPPSTELSNIFVWDYVNGLNRIELGGYRPVPGAPKTLGNLDKAFIEIVGTRPIATSVSEIIIVANRYVICDIDGNDVYWRAANKADFGGINVNGDIGNYVAAQSPKLATLSFSDLVANRRPLAATEFPTHPIVQEIRVIPGQHGWLVADKEL